ncbi:MAG: calcineurin-like phosphoesterase family protein [Pirellulaceae bacterium]|nr:calcineurin-like phosphoesterase family protein [Pirellulaceae bacterium]
MTKPAFFLAWSLAFHITCCGLVAADEVARGIVFVDRNENGVLDADEQRLSGIRVSNGRQIVLTTAGGAYEIPLAVDQTVFVIKPRGFRTLLSEDGLPRFYYTHKPEGSPQLRFAGVEPTGPLPSMINFPLVPQNETDQFRAILFGDPQPRNLQEVRFIAADIIPELVGTDASFGVTLGDIAFDDLSTFKPLNQTIGVLGIPWYNVLGNHDINFDVPDRKYSAETFQSIYGPTYYSYDYGNVHFVVMDNINYFIDPSTAKGKYDATFGERQLEFLKNDLALVPQDSLVVLMMHIPLVGAVDRQEVYRLIEERPFCVSISGHTHFHEHRLIDASDGWRGKAPHHHIINVTVSGSWWGGNRDERGIPHAMMSDGAPNGYSIMEFNHHNYQLDFYPAGRPQNYQMDIVLPENIVVNQLQELPLIANVFNATPLDRVEARIGPEGSWVAMENYTGIAPLLVELRKRELKPDGKPMLGEPHTTNHLWRLSLESLGPQLSAGHHLLQVRWTDQQGRTTISNKVLMISE